VLGTLAITPLHELLEVARDAGGEDPLEAGGNAADHLLTHHALGAQRTVLGGQVERDAVGVEDLHARAQRSGRG
jgi:hypothetical protein